MATVAKPKPNQSDRLEQEGRDWYERNAEDMKRCACAKDLAKMAFEAGWRAAFEVALNHHRPEL